MRKKERFNQNLDEAIQDNKNIVSQKFQKRLQEKNFENSSVYSKKSMMTKDQLSKYFKDKTAKI